METCWSLEELTSTIIEVFLNKTNFLSILEGNLDNDSGYPYGVNSDPTLVFVKEITANYNITTSFITSSTTTSSITGTLTSAYDVAGSFVQSNWASGNYRSSVVYISNISLDVTIQAGKSVSIAVTEPWLTSGIDTLIFTTSGVYSWINYLPASKSLVFQSPKIFPLGATREFVETLETTYGGKIYSLLYNIKVYSWGMENWEEWDITNVNVCK